MGGELMNNTTTATANRIANPVAYAKRKAERQTRRLRPDYPSLSAGRGMLYDRAECGETKRLSFGKSRMLSGQFVFIRAAIPVSRSRHQPHVGKKELGKIAMRAPFNSATIG